ncbi:MAG: hemolysin activation/secretion protein [Betaproteobacteria bacterium]|nr:hemolysin activation/secretion protein [Betaproteobacteria bacterium]
MFKTHPKLAQLFWVFLLMPGLFSFSSSAQTPVPADRAAFAPAEVEHRFDILEYQVEGNSVLSAAAIEKAVTPFLGEQRAAGDVEAARAALEKTYQNAGFLSVYVQTPEQKIVDGVVVLQVVEGSVQKLRVTGARSTNPEVIREQVPALAAGEVPYFPEMQEQLAQLSRGDDRKVVPVLRAGTTPGTLEAELKVDDKTPFHGSLELNNRYSFDTDRLRLSASLRYDNLWQAGHSLSVSYQTTPEDPQQIKVFSGTYAIPLEGAGAIAIYAVHSGSQLTTVGSTGVIGRGNIIGLRYIRPLPPLPSYTHSLVAGVDYKDFTDTTTPLGADSGIASPIRYMPFTVGYNAKVAGDGGSQTQFSVTANWHVRDLGDMQVDCAGVQVNAFACKRFGADANYFYARGELSRLQMLPGKWSLFAKASGQYANQPLISNEQFGLGGADTVRGYTEYERLGDRALLGTVELRTPNLRDPANSGLRDMNFLLFGDYGDATVVQALPSQQNRFHLASVGFGLRAKGWKSFDAALDLAWPLLDGSRGTSRDPHLHFRLAYDF